MIPQKKIYRFLILQLLIIGFSLVNVYAKTIVAGYYPSWVKAQLPADKMAMDKLTHVIHSFVIPGSDGSLNYGGDFLYPQLNTKVHSAGKKITVALGGWGGSDGFPIIAASPALRTAFIGNIISFCITNNYDGIDIDWEHPANVNDKNNLVTLVKEMREAFTASGRNLLISMAVTAGPWAGQWVDYDSLSSSIDWFGCMSYDFHGEWTDHSGHNSPLYSSGGDNCGSVHEGFLYLSSTRHVPLDKILIGIPFYGRQFNAARLYGPATGGDVSLNYSDISSLIGNGWIYNWDNTAKVPYLLNTTHTQFITYDDTASVRLKFQYALDKKIAGVMIWALGFDVINDEQQLLNTIGHIAASVEPDIIKTESFNLFQNYPNPFNGSSVICYEVAQTSPVKIDVYDINGRQVANLVDSIQPPQRYSIAFNAENLPSGIYMYRMKTPANIKTGKMVLIK